MRLLTLLVASIATVAFAACGGDEETTTEDAVTVDIADFKYDPETVTVAAGAEITWVNEDDANHTATADPGFDTGTLAQGDEKAVTAPEPGTYEYTCTFHPFMKGTVTVE